MLEGKKAIDEGDCGLTGLFNQSLKSHLSVVDNLSVVMRTQRGFDSDNHVVVFVRS